ncbi:hypothetical protein CEXT_764811 [Caerostris extrusa]|uniref:Uncharacterized protein n=1 Tax=Caerostris extrusa TaxID=172846 RepID=A0AAV4NXL6_CAEEX|nr:hypothetical protein CEXT_764811 [Caerostris extrusa]
MKRDGQEPAEYSPLKDNIIKMDIGGTADNSGANKGFRKWLPDSKVKWGIVIFMAIVLCAVITVVTVLVLKVDYDSSRLVKIWPRPEMPEHIIRFEHGSDGSNHLEDMNKVCYFDIQPFMRGCSHANNYGYDIGMPCVFLEFNNITGWVPEPYSPEELQNT